MDLLTINEKKVRAALARARQELERNPTFWPTLEEVGRCLHWLKDPAAADYFRQAAAVYPIDSQPDLGYLTVGNYHRLSGDPEQSREAYARADAILATRMQESEPVINERLICAFMLGDDDAVEVLARRLQGRRKQPDPGLIVFPLARVARAAETGQRRSDAGCR